MDASPNPARDSAPGSPAQPGPRGGSIEPDGRSPDKSRAATNPTRPGTNARPQPGERYELRDPFAETLYHAKRFDEMAAKAEQLGSNRFTAIDAQGRRTLVRQVDGQWTRGPLRSVDGLPAQPSSGTRDAMAPEASASPPAHRPQRDKERQGPAKPIPTPAASPEPTKPEAVEVRRIAQAERAARVAQLETALIERYVVKRAGSVAELATATAEYRFRGDSTRVAFTANPFKLATDTNSPSVARSMVDVAETRQWKALRVTGNEDFKRMVWLEASLRRIRTVGYQPTQADQEQLKREREARQVNRIEPAPEAAAKSNTDPANASARGGGSRKAVLAAIEAVLVARRVPEKQREAVMAAATEKLAKRTRETPAAKIKVYDMAAPAQRPAITPNLEMQRSHERAGPAPAR